MTHFSNLIYTLYLEAHLLLEQHTPAIYINSATAETQVGKQEEIEVTYINGVPTHVLGTHILFY